LSNCSDGAGRFKLKSWRMLWLTIESVSRFRIGVQTSNLEVKATCRKRRFQASTKYDVECDVTPKTLRDWPRHK
jgi:hypothetical protein